MIVSVLDEADISLLKSYGQGPYTKVIKNIEEDIQKNVKKVKNLLLAIYDSVL